MSDDIAKIQIALLEDLELFTKFFFNAYYGLKFHVNSHHKVLFEKASDVMNGKEKRLILNVAPRYSKTEIMVKMFIAWTLARNPKAKFIHISYSDKLALSNSDEIKSIVESAEYQKLFHWVKISENTKAKQEWRTTVGGGVLARASGGQITGFGAGLTDFDNEQDLFGGAIIIDDPIKPDDVNSDVKREEVNYKFNSTIRNRVNSRNTPIIIIMQRVHPYDLCGFLLENEPDDWTEIKMPVAKLKSGSLWNFELSETKLRNLTESEKQDFANDIEPLWASKHNARELVDMYVNFPNIFNTQYQQNARPKEGYLIPIQDLRFLPNDIDCEIITKVCFIDPSERGGDMMSVIFTTMSTFQGKFNVHIDDVIHSNTGYEEISEAAYFKALEYQTENIYVEKNGVGLATFQKLKQLIQPDDRINLKPFAMTENKQAKILSCFEFIVRYFSFNASYERQADYRKFINHLTTYTSAGNNAHTLDALDNCANASLIIRRLYSKIIY